MIKLKTLLLIAITIFTSAHYSFSQGTLWGVTAQGGEFGNIFSMPTGSTGLSSNYHLKGYSGRLPQYTTPVKATNGKLYCLTSLGGVKSLGVLVEYDPINNIYKKLFDFDGTLHGSIPYGSLIQASNGKLYGMTFFGGTNNLGTLFEYNISTNILTKKADFLGSTNGGKPTGALTESSTGKLYGLTSLGGTNNLGTLFEFDTLTAVLTKKIDFAGTSNGSSPQGSLMNALNGKMYGLTRTGGANNQGVLFEYDFSNNSLVKKIDFLSASLGQLPYGDLFQASNGLLYGMTSSGGTTNSGTIFNYDYTTNTILKKYDFNGTSNGGNPYGTFIEGATGNLHGSARNGGNPGFGVLFVFNITTDTYTKKYEFNGSDGIYPQGGFAKATNGKLYALAYQGGIVNDGALFEYDFVNNIYAVKAHLNTSVEGVEPCNNLMMAANGKLYCGTASGGAFFKGVIFEYDMPTNSYTKKFDFAGISNGELPVGKMVEGVNGKLYGMTFGGGANNQGVLFEYDYITNTYTKKFDFGGLPGETPQGSLIKASNGKLYGMTYNGGVSGFGVIFEYDCITNTYTKKVDFINGNEYYPRGDLLEASPGKLYGVTTSGGNFGGGALFEYNFISNVYTKKADFNVSTIGDLPAGNLIKAANGKLYGLCPTGGPIGLGTLYEYDINTSVLLKKVDFTGTANGDKPVGSLIEAQNGKMYGVTYQGGLNNVGVLFEYIAGAAAVTKKMDFNTVNGKYPQKTQLLEICPIPQNAGTITSSTNQFCYGFGNNISLTTNTLSGATSYTWNLPMGANVLSGSGTTSLSVDFSNVASGIYTITFSGTNACGFGASSPKIITINAAPSISATSSNALLCSGQTATLTANGASSYTWSTSGTGTSILVSPLITSSYTVTGTDINGCVNSSTITQTVTICSGINQISVTNNLIEIYPNPFSDKMTIVSNGTKQMLQIVNALGVIVYQTILSETKTEIDFSDHNKGIYLIRVGTLTKTIIKE